MLSLSFVARKPKDFILDFSVFSLGDLRVSLILGVSESNLVVSLSSLVVLISNLVVSLSNLGVPVSTSPSSRSVISSSLCRVLSSLSRTSSTLSLEPRLESRLHLLIGKKSSVLFDLYVTVVSILVYLSFSVRDTLFCLLPPEVMMKVRR